MSAGTAGGEAANAGDPDGRPGWGEPTTKTVSWYDPKIALAARPAMTGIEYVRAVAEGRLPPQPIAAVMDFTVSDISEGQVTVNCVPDQSLLNTNGMVHGGVLCTMMDAAMGIASLTTLPAGQATVTVELKVSFLKPLAHDGRGFAVVGHILRAGRRISYAEAHAYAADGTLVGHGSSTFAAVPANAPA